MAITDIGGGFLKKDRLQIDTQVIVDDLTEGDGSAAVFFSDVIHCSLDGFTLFPLFR